MEELKLLGSRVDVEKIEAVIDSIVANVEPDSDWNRLVLAVVAEEVILKICKAKRPKVYWDAHFRALSDTARMLVESSWVVS